MLLSAGLTGCNSVPSLPNNTTDINGVAPYPAPKPGYHRYAVVLPKRAVENNYKVELIIGKPLLVDCNYHQLNGKIKKQTIPGWEHYFYIVESKGEATSTLKGCLINQEKIQFVAIPNKLGAVPYNSSVPIVIYTPTDIQVRYRIWSMTGETMNAIRD